MTRDRLMTRLALAHPGYGFERHMGYSVPEHVAALERLGPTIHHRRSFSPVAAQYLGEDHADPDEIVAGRVASLAAGATILWCMILSENRFPLFGIMH